jgi:undecaprenyl-diphosphatase
MSLALASAVAFAVVAVVVGSGALYSLDQDIVHWVAGQRRPWLDKVMLQVTTLGDGIVVTMIALVASAFLWLTRHRWSAGMILMAVPGGQVVNNGLKLLFRRDRPDFVERIDAVATLSFPSGHAMSAVIAYGALAYVLARFEPTTTMRRATWAFAVLLILLIGASRTYLGVHYPSDVIAGYIAGVTWLALVAAIMDPDRRSLPASQD